mmetsp:Transcript_102533/g.293556  ORF Transcript_102533/g.293556 Transcript_102533/m.293556 type:complete len:323 (+) Transcript_102533:690-1658(+)
MTWSGWVANMVSSEPEAPRGARERRAGDSRPNAQNELLYAKPQAGAGRGGGGGGGGGAPNKDWGGTSANAATGGSTGSVAQQQFEAQDRYLEAQLENIEEMSRMGTVMSGAIAGQIDQVNGMTDQVDDMQDETRALTRMAGRMHSKVRGKPVMRGWIALQHVASGKYLDLVGEELVLAQQLRNTGRWEAHERDGDGVSGLKSVVSRRWVGQSMTGKIRCRASAFGTWEEWDICYDRPAALLCCSANSGGGGWVIVDEETEKLVAGDGTLKDKKRAAMWRVIEIDESMLAGGRLKSIVPENGKKGRKEQVSDHATRIACGAYQ